jgi:hydroxymethylpyrimidine/phosphomethylpyrimidine kinase
MSEPNSAAVTAALARGPPDLQALVEAHELYCNIPHETWRRYDVALAKCKRLLRAKHVIIKGGEQADFDFLFLIGT